MSTVKGLWYIDENIRSLFYTESKQLGIYKIRKGNTCYSYYKYADTNQKKSYA